MPDIHRRDVLRTGAAIAAAGTIVVPSALVAKGAFGDQEVAEIANLERQFVDADRAHLQAIEAAGRFPIGCDSPEHEAAEEQSSLACGAAWQLEAALVDFPVTTLAGLLAKGQAMQRTLDWECAPDGADRALAADCVRLLGGAHV